MGAQVEGNDDDKKLHENAQVFPAQASKTGKLSSKLRAAYSQSAAMKQVVTFSKLLAAALIYHGDAATAEDAMKRVKELLKDVSDPLSEDQFIKVLKKTGPGV